MHVYAGQGVLHPPTKPAIITSAAVRQPGGSLALGPMTKPQRTLLYLLTITVAILAAYALIVTNRINQLDTPHQPTIPTTPLTT